MIRYRSRGRYIVTNTCRLTGSVFPVAFIIAAPASIICGLLKWLVSEGHLESVDGLGENDKILPETTVWSGFSFLVGFLVVFRTSISYSRFWDGVTSSHRMRAEWYDACSAAVAFCKNSKASQELKSRFRHTLICLCSLLHALALSEIEHSNSEELEGGRGPGFQHALGFEVLSVRSIDAASLRTLRGSKARTELVFQWIQELLVENIETGVLNIPPPLLSRVFHELGNGMVALHESVRVSSVPFPFPYAQACDTLLILHWLITPVISHQWVESPGWAVLFTFTQVFILWALNLTASEIQNPFGSDPNDLDGFEMQKEMNEHLSQLLMEKTVPTLPEASKECSSEESLMDMWLLMGMADEPCQGAANETLVVLHHSAVGQAAAGQRPESRRQASSRRGCFPQKLLGSGSAPSTSCSGHPSRQSQRQDGDACQVPSAVSVSAQSGSVSGESASARSRDPDGLPNDTSKILSASGLGADSLVNGTHAASASSSGSSFAL